MVVSITERQLQGRINAHKLHATHDSKELTSAARRAFNARFEKEADPDGTLPEEERLRRVYHLRQAYFAKLSLASAKARRERAHRRKYGVAS